MCQVWITTSATWSKSEAPGEKAVIAELDRIPSDGFEHEGRFRQLRS